MSTEKKTWHPAGIYKGVFDGLVVQANRHRSEDGQETAWHTTSYSNSGTPKLSDYWVADGQFRKTLKQLIDPHEVVTGEIISETPDAERKAILKAIEEWSTREPDIV